MKRHSSETASWLRKLVKYTHAGRYRRVAKRLDRLKRSDIDAALDYRDSDGRNLLHIAAAEGHGRLVRAFSELGCSPVARDANGNTPAHLILYYCLQSGRSPVFAERLLANLSASPAWKKKELAQLTNSTGVACCDLLARLAQQEAVSAAAAEAALSASVAGDSTDDDEAESWHRRLADAAADDAADFAGENFVNKDYNDEDKEFAFETLDDWFERMGREYAERRRQVKLRLPLPGDQHQRRQQLPQPPTYKQLKSETLAPTAMEAYLRYKDSYLAFFKASGRVIASVDDVPWPPFLTADGSPEATLRALRLAVSDTAELRCELRQLRVLWHPDRFLQKFGDRLAGSDPVRLAVTRKVTLASQLVNGAMALLTATAS